MNTKCVQFLKFYSIKWKEKNSWKLYAFICLGIFSIFNFLFFSTVLEENFPFFKKNCPFFQKIFPLFKKNVPFFKKNLILFMKRRIWIFFYWRIRYFQDAYVLQILIFWRCFCSKEAPVFVLMHIDWFWIDCIGKMLMSCISMVLTISKRKLRHSFR